VRAHDFIIPELGRANPYGIYDIAHNTGWVSVGMDHDTAAFAVESIRRWWNSMGQAVYPRATRLLITADSGGATEHECAFWKVELQKLGGRNRLADRGQSSATGTSKWNKIEHRLFSFISQNWRGKPLISHEVIVNLMPAPRPPRVSRSTRVRHRHLPSRGQSVGSEVAEIDLHRDKFHGDWNYTLHPRPR